MKPEFIARVFLFLSLVAASAAGVIAAAPGLGFTDQGGYELHARMPENGGWSIESIDAKVGEPVHLRMTSDDVVHSFAVGQSSEEPVELIPGKWVETTLVFDRPGRYTFYCTRWCGRNHWRMRGTIYVTGEGAETVEPVEKPLYLALGIDVDAPHSAETVPQGQPSAERGKALEPRLPAYALERDTYLKYSPETVWLRLRAEPSLADLDDLALWDAVAWLWLRQTSPEMLAKAADLFATNCAACHGETGKGDGVMVEGLPRFDPSTAHASQRLESRQLSRPSEDQEAALLAEHEIALSAPGDFTDPKLLLGASPALLKGKMLRGGMGTGMPYWGPVLTDAELDALVAYLYTFARLK